MLKRPVTPAEECSVELIDLVPNSLTFRMITTLDITDESDIPDGFSGRVRFHRNDHVEYVAWYQDGVLHNTGRRNAAYRRYRSDGSLKYEMHYHHGALHDAARDLPAVRGWYSNGQVHYEERWYRGRRSDAVDGTPAIRKWRADGSCRHELRYKRGARVTARS